MIKVNYLGYMLVFNNITQYYKLYKICQLSATVLFYCFGRSPAVCNISVVVLFLYTRGRCDIITLEGGGQIPV